MARKFVVSLDLNKNELLNARIQNLGSAPSTPVSGQIYYDTGTNIMYFYNGSAWIPTSGSTEVIQDTVNELLVAGEGIDLTYNDNAGTLTIDAEVATHSNLGVASFNDTDFSIASGAVSLNAERVEDIVGGMVTNNSESGISVTYNDNDAKLEFSVTDQFPSKTTDNLAEGSANKYFTDERAQDAVNTALTAGTGITKSYDDNANTITLAVDTSVIATRSYVDTAVSGIAWKEAVHLLADSNVALSGTSGTLVIDSHAALGPTDNGYRILLKGQSPAATENGIYVYNDAGSGYTLTRSTDADANDELIGAGVFVMEGTVYGTTSWIQSNHYISAFANQSWVQFSGAGAYTAGNGLTQSGTTFNVGAGTGITVGANDVSIDTTVVARKYSNKFGNGVDTTFTITHNLGTKDITVQVYENSSPFAQVEVDVEHTSTSEVTIKTATVPTTDQYRVIVVG